MIIRSLDYPLCVVVLSNIGDSYRKVSKIGYDLMAMSVGVVLEKENDDQPAIVDPEILEEYSGDYELAPGVVLTFIHREGRLFTHGPGQPETEIYPISETEFSLKVVEGAGGARSGFSHTQMRMATINMMARSAPGIIPAMKSLPIDCSVRMP